MTAVHLAGQGWFAVYGLVLGVLLTAKMTLSLMPPQQWPTENARQLRVGVVIPIYNEDQGALRECLATLDRQTRRPDYVVLVDDGSQAREASRLAEQWAADRDHWRFIQMPTRGGKRHALEAAFRAFRGEVDVWVTVDSDTALAKSAIDEGVRPFGDPRVMAATGTVIAMNPRDGLLSALIDLRYVNAFLGERAAYSRLNSVLCVCGSLGFWRATVIDQHLDDFVSQMFLGQPATVGDDRRLTRYALEHGKVVLARKSIGYTAVPTRLGHYLRQQIRWGKSFWRESVSMLTTGSPRRVAWWLTAVEVVTWAGFSTGLASAVVLAPLSGSLRTSAGYGFWVAVIAWARSVHVFSVKGRGRRSLLAFAIAPLYGLLSLFVVLPLRLYSLLTIRSSGWGTRQKGVEVAV